MTASVVITVISKDRPGIVETLSRVLDKYQGSWAESSMSVLAGQFAGIVLVQLPAEQVDGFVEAMEGLEEEGLHVVCRRCGDGRAQARGAECILELVGQDHPGIVRDITHVLARQGVNVQALETWCESASMSGETLFHAQIQVRLPEGASLGGLRGELEDLANELMVDIDLAQS